MKISPSSDSRIASDLAELEERRLGLQTALDASKSQAERNRLGQFATPPNLANEIVAAARKLIASEPVRFLDPAFGTGAFLSAVLRAFAGDRLRRSEGYEIDRDYGEPAQRLWRDTGLVLHPTDFTQARAPESEAERFNLLICNPPYVRHHYLSATVKERLRRACGRICSERTNGLSGLYCYFLVLAHEWLADGGVGVWLIPSEFMDVNYGSWVKRYLVESITLLRIHRFDANEVQFADALVSSAVVFFRKRLPRSGHEAVFSRGGTLENPRREAMVPIAALTKEEKWSRASATEARPKPGYTLGDFFTVKRGLATGDNQYFILTSKRAEELDLPRRFLTPILPSPRYISDNEVRADSEGNPMTHPQLVLLDCRLPEDTVRQCHPTLWLYLREGETRGLPARYLCQQRSPWYAQEDRPAAPLVSTYMGRGQNDSRTPFRFIRNRSRATAANVYLLMYPKGALLTALHSRPELADEIWLRLNQLGRDTLLDQGRVYGGGLYKLEPRELANVCADDVAGLLGLPPRRAHEQLQLLG